MAYTIRPRYGTTAGYAALNRVYDAGELLCELGVDGLVRMKVADGVTAYNSLPYVVGGEGSGSLPAFGTISVPGQSNVVADAPGATATMIGSSGIALTTNAGTDTLTFAPEYGTTANTICQGNDSRLGGGGQPAAHAVTHGSGGTDAIKLDQLAVPDDVTALNSSTAAHGLLPKLSGISSTYLAGTGAWTTPASGAGAEVGFGTILVPGQPDIVIDSTPDILTLSPGAGIQITTNAGADTITISGGGSSTGIAYVDNFGAVGNGIADDSPAVNSAIASLSSMGGRVIFSAKPYRLASTIDVSHTIIFEGQGFQEGPSTSGASPTRPPRGTWLIHDHAGKGFTLSSFDNGQNSGFRDIAFWENHPTITSGWSPTVRDFCIYCSNAADRVELRNVHFHNVYKAVFGDNVGRLVLNHVTGQPLHTGVQQDKAYDMPRWQNIHFWPYWTSNEHVLDWTQANGTAFRVGRADGLYADHLFAFGYAHVMHLYVPTGDGGSATKLYIGNIWGDFCGRLLTVDQNNATLHINQITTQSIRWHNNLPERLGDGLISLANSSGIVVNSTYTKIYVGYLRVDEVIGPAVRLRASGNELNIDTAWFVKWNFRGAPGQPAVLCDSPSGGGPGNIVWFANNPKLTPWNAGDYLSGGDAGLSVLPTGINVVGNAPASIRGSNNITGSPVSFAAYNDASPGSNSDFLIIPLNSGRFGFSTTGAASATAGTSGALPGAPVGWINVVINGTERRLPYWGT